MAKSIRPTSVELTEIANYHADQLFSHGQMLMNLAIKNKYQCQMKADKFRADLTPSHLIYEFFDGHGVMVAKVYSNVSMYREALYRYYQVFVTSKAQLKKLQNAYHGDIPGMYPEKLEGKLLMNQVRGLTVSKQLQTEANILLAKSDKIEEQIAKLKLEAQGYRDQASELLSQI